ncbi:hypothetical protein BHU61_10625 [Macrococcus epidermidis]|uniref:Uncharacterized protein n=1 Tax=Macrococcus epidermidis TaxID=1902580 RepID=A0A327ZNP3_9STAP|nr:hypothetical protein [Macrococcus epidermidis]RAK43993.1 hypothetical protein BHU61_10625 [Macrococcus epidermidis]
MERRGTNKTYYLNDSTLNKIDELKEEKGFANMNQVLTYLFEKEEQALEDNYNLKSINDRLSTIDKKSEMILEIVSWSADRHDHIPMLSFKEGQNISYNKAKEFVEEKQMKAPIKKKSSFFL